MAIPIEMLRATRASGFTGRYLRPLLIVYAMAFRLIVMDSFFIFATLLMPIIYALLALGMLRNKGGDYAIYVVIGSGLSGLWTTLLFSGGNSISGERWTGTLEALAAAPTPLWLVVFGKNLASVTQSFLSIVVSYTLGSFLFGYPLTIAQPAPFFISLVLSIISYIFFGLMLAPLFVLNPSVQRFQNAMEYPVYILCGFLFPVALLPFWTTPVSYILSPYWSANALHWTSSGGGTPNQLLLSWGMMLLLSVVYLAIASVVFRIVLRKARVDATLGMQ